MLKESTYKRKLREERFKTTSKNLRIQKLTRTTRKVAARAYIKYINVEIEEFYNINYFSCSLSDYLYGTIHLQWGDIVMMYPLFIRCIKHLKKQEEKAIFLKKTYTPLEEDLFKIS